MKPISSLIKDFKKGKEVVFNCKEHGPQRYLCVSGSLYCPVCKEEEKRDRQLKEDLCSDSLRNFKACVDGVGIEYDDKEISIYGFDNFEQDTKEKEKAVYVASLFTDNFINRLLKQHKEKTKNNPQWNSANSRGLIFVGTTGTGKTHLSKAILSRLKQFGIRGLYIRFNDLVEYCSGYNKLQNRKLFRNLSVLVIDELGSGYWTDQARDTISQIIDERTALGKPTIVCHNLDVVELKNFAGERLNSRLCDQDKFYKVVCAWKDYRLRRRPKTVEEMF